ncbi:MAG: hypothetical protein PWQ77_1674 [Kosmotogales bacterium]|nr:hypothetical protein [Kosmotogales bacterium]
MQVTTLQAEIEKMCEVPEYMIEYISNETLNGVRRYFHDWEWLTPFSKKPLKIGNIERMSTEDYAKMGWFVEQVKYCRRCVNGISCQMTDLGLYNKMNEKRQKECIRGMIFIPQLNKFDDLYFEPCICMGIYTKFDFEYYWRKTPHEIKGKMIEKMQADPEFWELDAIKDFILSRREEKEKRKKY